MKFEEMLQDCKEKINTFITKNPNGILVIYGPTATGKTRLSIALSNFFPIEVISADSRQIFEQMNIGTDKIAKKYTEKVPHHQINIVSPDEKYTAGEWNIDTKRHILDIQKRNNIPCVVGGTGLYIDTLYKNYTLPNIAPNYALRNELEQKEKTNPGYLHKELQRIDPAEAKKQHPNSTRYLIRALEIFYESGKTKTQSCKEQAVEQPILMIGIKRDTKNTNILIEQRIHEMIAGGLVDEVKDLLQKGYAANLQSMQGIGYKEVIPYVKGKYDHETMIKELNQHTTHLAKKQRTRFRRYENDSIKNPKQNVQYLFYEIS